VSSNKLLKTLVYAHLKEYIRVPDNVKRQSSDDPQTVADLVRRHKFNVISKVIKEINVMNPVAGFVCLEGDTWWEISDEAACRIVKEMFATCRQEYLERRSRKKRKRESEEGKSSGDKVMGGETASPNAVPPKVTSSSSRWTERDSKISSKELQQKQDTIDLTGEMKEETRVEDKKINKKKEKKVVKKGKKTHRDDDSETNSPTVSHEERHPAKKKQKPKYSSPTETDNSDDEVSSTENSNVRKHLEFDHNLSSEDEDEQARSKGKRGFYRCGKCGQKKQGHICPFRKGGDKQQTRHVEVSETKSSDNDDEEENSMEGWNAYSGGIQVFKQDAYYTALPVSKEKNREEEKEEVAEETRKQQDNRAETSEEESDSDVDDDDDDALVF